MSSPAELFRNATQKNAFDEALHRKLNHSIRQYTKKHESGLSQFMYPDLARERASALKQKAIENLDRYLQEFEANFIKNGGKLIWARDAEEALEELGRIIERHEVKKAVKTKSMVSEEIGVNEFLAERNIDCPETDLGEFIQQEAGEPPFHIVTPAMHKSREEIATLFHEKFGTKENAGADELTAFARQYLRDKFFAAETGISGANFLIADCGAIAITENEGNGVLSMALPRIHIAIAGIEKILPSLNDLDLFWPLLATYGTGQRITTYNSVVFGPRKNNENDGPEEMYLILLDNGRTELLEQIEQRRALQCIRCGACLNACPVYNSIGGHAYHTTYSGPIGKVISPWMKGLKEYRHLSQASSLCGKCTEVCPVKIDIHKLLLYNRRDALNSGLQTLPERAMWTVWKKAMLDRRKMNRGHVKIKNALLQSFFRKAWGTERELPLLAEKSFNELMREKMGLK